MLTEHYAMFALYTKGHFSEYENPERWIVADALQCNPQDVTQGNMVNFAISVFDTLLKEGFIDGAEDDLHQWYIQEMRAMAHKANPPTLYEWLCSHIQGARADNLLIDLKTLSIQHRMQRKDNVIHK